MPAVVVERRADFLVQRIRLTNDTRAEEGRKKEIYQTIRDMQADAAKHPGIALGFGRIEIHGLSNRVSWQRSDISQLTLYIPYQVELTGCQ